MGFNTPYCGAFWLQRSVHFGFHTPTVWGPTPPQICGVSYVTHRSSDTPIPLGLEIHIWGFLGPRIFSVEPPPTPPIPVGLNIPHFWGGTSQIFGVYHPSPPTTDRDGARPGFFGGGAENPSFTHWIPCFMAAPPPQTHLLLHTVRSLQTLKEKEKKCFEAPPKKP